MSLDPRPKSMTRRGREGDASSMAMHRRLASFPLVRMGSWRRHRSASQEFDMVLTPDGSSGKAPVVRVRA